MLFLIRVLNKIKLLQYFNLKGTRQLNGNAYRIPLIGRVGFDLLFDDDTWMFAMLKRLLPIVQNKTFVDVGVNLGQTLLTAKSITPRIDYIGFEPNPMCVEFLSSMIRQNDLDGIHLIPMALGKTDGMATLYREKIRKEDSMATIIANFRSTENKEKIIVPLISAEKIEALQIKTIGVIKIDVEGAELEVIQTLLPVIHRDKPFVICEILPVYDATNTFRLDRQNTLLELMRNASYSFFRIGRDGSLLKISDIGIHANESDSNYLFAPIDTFSN